MKRNTIVAVLFFIAAAFGGGALLSLSSCATLNSLMGLTRVQFKLQDAVNVNLAGINMMGKKSMSDVSVMDGLNLGKAFVTGKFPLTFTLNVAAKNPNQKDPKSGISNTLSLQQFPWKMLIDGKETISGGIASPVSLPDGGTTTIIPLQVSVDLKQFFGNKSYEDMANLAMAIAGQGTSRLQLNAKPSISTPIGTMTYPKELNIVSTEFRN
jgi:hypothetical protein